MHTLKVNLYSFSRETFDDEVHDLVYEMKQCGRVESQQATPMFAQFRFATDMHLAAFRQHMEERGFSKENGFSVNFYVDDHELED